MSLILRVDVDKPYGNSNLLRKIVSKVIEDFMPIPMIGSYKYLSHCIEFLEYCNSVNVPGFIYHRICTTPNKRVVQLLKQGGHKLGLHAENTRSYDTFSKELETLRKKISDLPVDSFSKHGSGVIKIGKYHYPPYEPDNYLRWAELANVNYYFGNDICQNESDLYSKNNFFPKIFWIEREYRHENFNQLLDLVEAAKKEDVVVLIHPCNFDSTKEVKDDFKTLIELADINNVSWKVF